LFLSLAPKILLMALYSLIFSWQFDTDAYNRGNLSTSHVGKITARVNWPERQGRLRDGQNLTTDDTDRRENSMQIRVISAISGKVLFLIERTMLYAACPALKPDAHAH